MTDPNGKGDIYVAKVDPQGNQVWITNLGGSYGDVQGAGIALDGSGNVLVTGTFQVKAAGGNVVDAVDVSKVSAAGKIVSIRDFPTSQPFFFALGSGVAADAAGNVYVAGMFSGSLDLGPFLPPIASDPAWLLRPEAEPGGNPVWRRRSAGTLSPRRRVSRSMPRATRPSRAPPRRPSPATWS